MNCYNLLKALGVKASFFMIGVHVDNDYDRKEVSEIRDSYPMFLLCNHSYTHANYNHYHAYYNAPDSALRDFEKNEQKLNVPVKIVRTPGNSSWVVNGRIRALRLQNHSATCSTPTVMQQQAGMWNGVSVMAIHPSKAPTA